MIQGEEQNKMLTTTRPDHPSQLNFPTQEKEKSLLKIHFCQLSRSVSINISSARHKFGRLLKTA